MTVEGQPSGLGWMPDGSLLVVSMRDHRVLRRTPAGDVTVHADVSEHCRGHLNDMVVDATRASLRRPLRVRPDGGRRPRAGLADPDRSGRERRGRRRGPALPQRLGDHAGRPDADRRRDGRRPLLRLHDRAGRLAGRPPRLGAGRADARADHVRGHARAAPLRARRLRARRRGPPLVGGRGRRALRPARRGRRDRRRDPDAGRPQLLRLHARRRGRPLTADLRRARLRRGQPRRGSRGRRLRHASSTCRTPGCRSASVATSWLREPTSSLR